MTELKSLKQVIGEKPNYYGKKANKRRSTNEPWHDILLYIINKLSHDFPHTVWNKSAFIKFSKATCLWAGEKFTCADLFQISLEIM